MWILLWHHLHKDCCSSCSPFLEMLSQSNRGSSIVWGAQAQLWGVDLGSMFPTSHWRFWRCVGSNKTVTLGAYLESIPWWVQAVAVEKMFRCSISANVLLGQCIGLLPNMLAHHSAAHQNSCYDPTVRKRDSRRLVAVCYCKAFGKHVLQIRCVSCLDESWLLTLALM